MSKMFISKNNIVLFHFVISVVLLFKSVVASAGTLKVTDATNSKLYQGRDIKQMSCEELAIFLQILHI